jgi:hypothetical protein
MGLQRSECISLDGQILGRRAMARIAEAEIERLKKEISLERLVVAKGWSSPGTARISSAVAPSTQTERRAWW